MNAVLRPQAPGMQFDGSRDCPSVHEAYGDDWSRAGRKHVRHARGDPQREPSIKSTGRLAARTHPACRKPSDVV